MTWRQLRHLCNQTNRFYRRPQSVSQWCEFSDVLRVYPNYSRRLLAEFRGLVPSPSIPSSPNLVNVSPVETISERKIEVLQLLADGLTYQEIAQAMFVSVNTVKSHLKSIYGKLSVHNRREAVAHARVLHLIDPNE